MKDNLTPKDITPKLVEATKAYLETRAVAEVLRKEVDQVERKALAIVRLYNDLEVSHGLEQKRITEPGNVYLSEDEGALEYYYEAVDMNLRQAGIKPDDMQLDYCPALVAERAQLEAEWALTDEMAQIMDVYEGPGEFNNALLCMQNGLEKRQEFIDLVVGAIIAAGFLT